ncbi:ATP-dependent zinc metalloprotease FtsH 4 [Planctomycetes bacterium Pla163]|uniref:ATP-dependent zinc metalloprotease FtsH 4 n=1 Tax=Rohdeia mirabilis TaxID=2528008 RepID=A0A518D169_9BACT|nr:ATP-dependent zinc metalloprotease FtsH 4 [Planctomycetes bacterium Pla163]
MTDDPLLAALEQALAADPRNGVLWLHYAERLESAGRVDAELAALRNAAQIDATRADAEPRLIRALRRGGHLAEALIRAEELVERAPDGATLLELVRVHRARRDVDGEEATRERLAAQWPELLEQLADDDAPGGASDDASGAASTPTSEPRPAPADPAAPAQRANTAPTAGSDQGAPPEQALADRDPDDLEGWAEQFDWGDLRITFDDVVGLEEVKRQVELRIIAPFKNPEVYAAFGRKGGGGVLLYGPPGCGKTFVARATAGELGASFVSIGLHDVLDRYIGESEKALHAIFEEARRRKPTVLFFDEFDAIGGGRSGGSSHFWRTIVNQLLQEMDGMAGSNTDVLVFAATNTPWAVDAAFRRPGRFDRTLLVTPPDADARRELLRRALAKVPGGAELDLSKVVAKTDLLTGADLVSVAERAAERALEQSLRSGKVGSVGQKDLEKAARDVSSSAAEWFAAARNYARYANEGGQYDELSDYLKRVKKW